jgi:hypothetical protein
LEAAIRTNTEIRYKILSKQELQAYHYSSENEVINAAAETKGVKLDNGVVKKATGETN